MKPLTMAQVCADQGIRPGGTKGAAQHLRGIAAGLRDLGHHVQTYSRCPTEGPYPVDVLPLPALNSASTVDVIYERYSLGHLGGLEHARRLNVPFVLEVNAPLVDEAAKHRPDSIEPHHRAIEQELLASADLVITVATALSDWVGAHRRGPVLTQPNGFEPSWFTPHSPVRERAVDAPYQLVFLGHPKPWHGADRIVPLLAELARTEHRPRTLVIGGGPGAARLLAAADHEGLTDQITITGPLPPIEATRRLRDAAIGLAPYPRQSPFYFCPLKIVDYLAAGLAVVSTRQGDIGDLVSDAGILLDDPDDDIALVDAVRLLLHDDQQRSAMADSGRRKARATMTWKHVAANTAAAIAGIVDAYEVSPAGPSIEQGAPR